MPALPDACSRPVRPRPAITIRMPIRAAGQVLLPVTGSVSGLVTVVPSTVTSGGGVARLIVVVAPVVVVAAVVVGAVVVVASVVEVSCVVFTTVVVVAVVVVAAVVVAPSSSCAVVVAPVVVVAPSSSSPVVVVAVVVVPPSSSYRRRRRVVVVVVVAPVVVVGAVVVAPVVVVVVVRRRRRRRRALALTAAVVRVDQHVRRRWLLAVGSRACLVVVVRAVRARPPRQRATDDEVDLVEARHVPSRHRERQRVLRRGARRRGDLHSVDAGRAAVGEVSKQQLLVLRIESWRSATPSAASDTPIDSASQPCAAREPRPVRGDGVARIQAADRARLAQRRRVRHVVRTRSRGPPAPRTTSKRRSLTKPAPAVHPAGRHDRRIGREVGDDHERRARRGQRRPAPAAFATPAAVTRSPPATSTAPARRVKPRARVEGRTSRLLFVVVSDGPENAEHPALWLGPGSPGSPQAQRPIPPADQSLPTQYRLRSVQFAPYHSAWPARAIGRST